MYGREGELQTLPKTRLEDSKIGEPYRARGDGKVNLPTVRSLECNC